MRSKFGVRLRKESAEDSDEELPAKLRPRPLDGQPRFPFGPAASMCDCGRLCRALCRLGRGRVEAGRTDEEREEDEAAEGDPDLRHVRRRPCRPTFLFDPGGRFAYVWSLVVSLGFLYNLWVVSYRFALDEIRPATRLKWLCLDYAADALYALDIVFSLRTGFLHNGVLVTQPRRIRRHYTDTWAFYLDCLALLPVDFLYLSIGFVSAIRLLRLAKAYKFSRFLDATERHSDWPHTARALVTLHHLALILHWNTCTVFALRHLLPLPPNLLGSVPYDNYVASASLSLQLLFSAAPLAAAAPLGEGNWTLGPDGAPDSQLLLFLLVERLLGLLLLAVGVGNVTNIVLSRSNARKVFQSELEGVKTYMRLRSVPKGLQVKVVRWFDYLWESKKSGREDEVLHILPDRLKAEVAIQVHLETLKKVEIFRNTEPGFLCELVLKLKPSLFSPGDLVCRRGEVGKEMYIVGRGKLRVIGDDGGVLATLSGGAYFGEISLLNLGTEGNRRTASVVSVGYSDLFCLSRADIAQVLEDYPAARLRLEQIAHRRLKEKFEMSLRNSQLLTPGGEGDARRFSAPPSLLHKLHKVNRADGRPLAIPAINVTRHSITPTLSPAPRVPPPPPPSDSTTPLLKFTQTTDESYI